MRRGRLLAAATVVARPERANVLNQHLDLADERLEAAALIAQGLVE